MLRYSIFTKNIFAKESKGAYETANEQNACSIFKEAFTRWRDHFLAANPDLKKKGIGTKLLTEFEKERKEKKYSFTDSGCTYQFYERRGFERLKEKLAR